MKPGTSAYLAAISAVVSAGVAGADDSRSAAVEVNDGIARCATAYRTGNTASAFEGWQVERPSSSFCEGCSEHSTFVSARSGVMAAAAITEDGGFTCSIYLEWLQEGEVSDEFPRLASTWLQESYAAGEAVSIAGDCWRNDVPVVLKIENGRDADAFVSFGAYKTEDGAMVIADISNETPNGSCS